mmetsp:Transcript_10328/g.32177  ORF Transcript_10328/g.32177 Transcript_10328/m.32177 type:complete len:286 (-) Transcript_10328:799-1656(-)
MSAHRGRPVLEHLPAEVLSERRPASQDPAKVGEAHAPGALMAEKPPQCTKVLRTDGDVKRMQACEHLLSAERGIPVLVKCTEGLLIRRVPQIDTLPEALEEQIHALHALAALLVAHHRPFQNRSELGVADLAVPIQVEVTSNFVDVFIRAVVAEEALTHGLQEVSSRDKSVVAPVQCSECVAQTQVVPIYFLQHDVLRILHLAAEISLWLRPRLLRLHRLHQPVEMSAAADARMPVRQAAVSEAIESLDLAAHKLWSTPVWQAAIPDAIPSLDLAAQRLQSMPVG